MKIDFRVIRRRLRWQLHRLRLRASEAHIAVLSRGIDLIDEEILGEDKTNAAELETRGQANAAERKNQRENALFMVVGHALSAWARMEDSLVAIARMLLVTKFTKAGAVMYSIINFNVWLSLIDELFVLEPHYSSLKSKWNKINEKLRGIKDTRDRLAHHSIYSRDHISATSETSLSPARFDTRQKSLKYEPLTLEQISAFTHSLAEIIGDLTALMNAIQKLAESEPWS